MVSGRKQKFSSGHPLFDLFAGTHIYGDFIFRGLDTPEKQSPLFLYLYVFIFTFSVLAGIFNIYGLFNGR